MRSFAIPITFPRQPIDSPRLLAIALVTLAGSSLRHAQGNVTL